MEDTRYERLRMDVLTFSTPDILTTSLLNSESWSGDKEEYGDNATPFNPSN